jgi:DsbC/DsbD-like thiol-disulfide interchange protein
MNFGYEGTLLLAVPVTVPAGFSGDTLDVKLRAEWLVCKDVCIPESGEFALRAARPAPPPRATARCSSGAGRAAAGRGRAEAAARRRGRRAGGAGGRPAGRLARQARWPSCPRPPA